MALRRRGFFWLTDLSRPGRGRPINTNQTHRGLALAVESQMRSALREGRRAAAAKGAKRRKSKRRNPLRFGEAVDRYIQTVMLSGTKTFEDGIPGNVANELYRTERLIQHFGFTTPVSKVASWKAVSAFNREMLKSLSKSSANRLLTMLRAILNKAYESGDLGAPAYVRLNRTKSQRNHFLTPSEERKLVQACPIQIRSFVIFLLDTGARLTEAQWLTWRHVDLKRKPRPIVIFANTKNGDSRSVPLPKRAAEVLRKMHAKHSRVDELVFSELASRKITDKYGNPFCKKGDRIPLSAIGPKFREARRKVGLDDVRIHDLRHTYASKLVGAGVPIFEVAKLMGHRRVEMTMRYAHLATGGLDKAVAVLD